GGRVGPAAGQIRRKAAQAPSRARCPRRRQASRSSAASLDRRLRTVLSIRPHGPVNSFALRRNCFDGGLTRARLGLRRPKILRDGERNASKAARMIIKTAICLLSTGCGLSVARADEILTITHQGIARTATVYTPAGLSDGPAPVVIALYGRGSTIEGLRGSL